VNWYQLLSCRYPPLQDELRFPPYVTESLFTSLDFGIRKSFSSSPIGYQYIAADAASLLRVQFGTCYQSIGLWRFLCGIGGTLQRIHDGCSHRNIGMAHTPPGAPSSSIDFRPNSIKAVPAFSIHRAIIVDYVGHICLNCAMGAILLSARRRCDHRHHDFPISHASPSGSNSPTEI
jgi:hypothetical protein